MSKSISLVVCVVCMAALIGVGAVSAQAKTSVPVLARPFASVTTNTADSSLTVPASLLPTNKSHNGSGEDEGNGRDDAPAPVPEPSTLLSFGVALIIGGGVYFLGRLRKERK